jgi:hypothetical protein
MNPDIAATVIGSLGGGALGAGVKILMSIISAAHRRKLDAEHEATERRLAELGLQRQAAEAAIRSDGNFAAWTRRLLALSMCWTFCAIAIVWAIWPTAQITVPHGGAGRRTSILFGLIEWSGAADLATVSSGSIVWAMIPFMSMILATYFTPDLTK